MPVVLSALLLKPSILELNGPVITSLKEAPATIPQNGSTVESTDSNGAVGQSVVSIVGNGDALEEDSFVMSDLLEEIGPKCTHS